MNSNCKLSNVTKTYLARFNNILDRMIEEMTSAELTDSISHNFIVQMIPHHRAAIEMSENILKYTTNVTLQNIAGNIIAEQTASIENMEKIKETCFALDNTDTDNFLYERGVKPILNTMFSGMETACFDNNVTCNFMREMIPHHLGAVRMCENALKYDICTELVPIMRSIIRSQEKGICQMRSLLNCLGCRE